MFCVIAYEYLPAVSGSLLKRQEESFENGWAVSGRGVSCEGWNRRIIGPAEVSQLRRHRSLQNRYMQAIVCGSNYEFLVGGKGGGAMTLAGPGIWVFRLYRCQARW